MTKPNINRNNLREFICLEYVSQIWNLASLKKVNVKAGTAWLMDGKNGGLPLNMMRKK